MGKFILKGSIGTVDIIELHGILLEKNTVELRDKLVERLKQGITDIVMLCEQFKQIDSTGISLFIEISDNLQSRGGKLHLVGCPLSVMIPMKSLGMINFFQFYKTEREALQNLQIGHDDLGKLMTQKKTKMPAQCKRQVAIKDHVRNKMILFKHYETSTIKDVILYLQSTYAHFRAKEIELVLRGEKLPQNCSLKQLFEERNYKPKTMLTVVDVTPEPPNYEEMVKRGGKLYDQAVLEILIEKGCLERELAESVKQIANLNQEAVTTTLQEGDYLSEAQILQTVGAFFNWNTVNLKDVDAREIVETIPVKTAEKYCVFPIRRKEKKLWVATKNPLDEKMLADLQKSTGYQVVPIFATEPAIKQKLEEQALLSPQSQDQLQPVEQIPYKETEVTGYFSVDSFLSSKHNVRNLQEYSLAGSLPGFIEDSLVALRKLVKSWELFQKFAWQISEKRDLNSVLAAILDTLVSMVPIEHGLFLLDLDGTGDLNVRKFEGLEDYQSLSEKSFYEIASYSLISRVKETHNIVGALSERDHATHLAVPFVSRNEKLLGMLYLISPKEHGMYDMESIKPLSALFGWGATIIENEMLSNKIEKLKKKGDNR